MGFVEERWPMQRAHCESKFMSPPSPSLNPRLPPYDADDELLFLKNVFFNSQSLHLS